MKLYTSKLPNMLRYHKISKIDKAKELGLSYPTFSARIQRPTELKVIDVINLCRSTPELKMSPGELVELVYSELIRYEEKVKKSNKDV